MSKFNEKYFNATEINTDKIENFLKEGEEIIWQDKPKKSAFILSKILSMLPIALIWLAFDGFFIFMLARSGAVHSMPTFFIVFLVVFFIFHLTPVWVWLSNIFTAWAQHKNVEYALTNKRIIVKSGIIVDIKNIYYSEIESVNLRVGLVDKILKAGDIYIKSTNAATVLSDIANPYLIANKLQQIVNDIKTDISFPNALRPNENKGYNTKYKADKQ